MSSEVVADNTAVGEIDGLIFKVIHANFGHKDHAVVAFSGISIILSTIVIVGVITHIFYIDARKCVYFRISATLAFCNIVYGLVQILLFDNKLTNRLTDIQLRSLYFLYLVSLCSIILNTCCIALHLHLTTITTNLRIAIRISPFYEFMSWTIAGIICHPVFYTFYQMKKIPISGAIVIFEKSWSDFYRHITCISCFYILGLVYCAYVCIEVIHRLLPIWIRIKRFDSMSNSRDFHDPEVQYQQLINKASPPASFNTSQKSSQHSESPSVISQACDRVPATGLAGSVTEPASTFGVRDKPGAFLVSASSNKPCVPYLNSPNVVTSPTSPKDLLAKRRRQVRFGVTRLAAHMLIPLCTITMFPIYMLLKKPTSSLGYATVLMPSFGGLFNFLVFLMQPTLDPLRTVFFRWCKRVVGHKGCERGKCAGNLAVKKAGRTGVLRKVNAWRHPSSSQQFLTIDGNDDGPVQTAAATDKHNSGTISSILNHGHDHQQPPSLSLLASPQQHQSQPNHVTVQFNSHRANPEIFYSSQYRDYQPVYDYSLNSQMPPPYKAL